MMTAERRVFSCEHYFISTNRVVLLLLVVVVFLFVLVAMVVEVVELVLVVLVVMVLVVNHQHHTSVISTEEVYCGTMVVLDKAPPPPPPSPSPPPRDRSVQLVVTARVRNSCKTNSLR